MTDDSTPNHVSKVNRFGVPPTPNDNSDSTAATIPLPSQLTILFQQVTAAQDRISTLEKQLRDSEDGRREDNERLLRELMDAKIENATLTERLRQRNEKSGE